MTGTLTAVSPIEDTVVETWLDLTSVTNPDFKITRTLTWRARLTVEATPEAVTLEVTLDASTIASWLNNPALTPLSVQWTPPDRYSDNAFGPTKGVFLIHDRDDRLLYALQYGRNGLYPPQDEVLGDAIPYTISNRFCDHIVDTSCGRVIASYSLVVGHDNSLLAPGAETAVETSTGTFQVRHLDTVYRRYGAITGGCADGLYGQTVLEAVRID